MEMMLKDAEGSLEKEIDQEKLRRDQVLLYSLLGDPATRLRLPEPLAATVERTAARVGWRVQKPPEATSLEVGFRNRSSTPLLPARKAGDADAADKAAEVANNRFGFQALPSPPRDNVWEGSCTTAGWLRLVASTPKGLYVAVLKLE